MSIEEERSNSRDLDQIAITGADGGIGRTPEHEASPSGRSAATLEVELKQAKEEIQAHNAERLLLVLILFVVTDVFIFRNITAWAPVLVIGALEFVVVFVLAYRLGLMEIVTLFWAAMRTYGKRDPGDPPGK